MDICSGDESYPDIKAGDVVKVGNDYQIICVNHGHSLQANNRRMFSLTDGNIWSTTSLWGSLIPSDVKKVNGCFKLS